MLVQPYACVKIVNYTRTESLIHCDFVMAVDENLTPVLLSAMCTCFMSHLLVLVLVLVSRELVSVTRSRSWHCCSRSWPWS